MIARTWVVVQPLLLLVDVQRSAAADRSYRHCVEPVPLTPVVCDENAVAYVRQPPPWAPSDGAAGSSEPPQAQRTPARTSPPGSVDFMAADDTIVCAGVLQPAPEARKLLVTRASAGLSRTGGRARGGLR